MELESWSWTARFWYRVLSYYFSVEANEEWLASHVDTVIGLFRVERDRSEEPNPPTPGHPVRYRLAALDETPLYRIYHNQTLMAGGEDVGYVFDQLFWHINAEAVRQTGEYVLIHSGAVSTPAGQGVLIPGPSGTGKSSLVAGLVRGGFSYYSDEAAAIDPIGRLLHPYPKAITLKSTAVPDEYPDLETLHIDDRVGNRWYIDPTSVRPDIIGSPCPVGFIFVSRYSPGTSGSIEEVSAAEAASTLGHSVMNIGRYRSRVLPLLAGLAQQARCYSMVSGNLRDAVAMITEATESGPEG